MLSLEIHTIFFSEVDHKTLLTHAEYVLIINHLLTVSLFQRFPPVNLSHATLSLASIVPVMKKGKSTSCKWYLKSK